MFNIQIRYAQVGKLNIFYREAGSESAPVILLLHGFPSSSHQYRNLIPILATKYRVVAPDLPGFGFTKVPDDFKYTFANFATAIGDFIDVLSITKFSVYVFDYGAPTGLRLALQRPEAVTAIFSQNGNAYLDGLGEIWAPIRQYWKTGSTEDREKLRPALLGFESVKGQYTFGSQHPEAIPPETYYLDFALLSRPGNQDIQLDIFKDYATNLDVYPAFQEYFRKSQVPMLVMWGKNDPFFIPPGAEAFKRDLPKAEIHLLDAGHFAGETNTKEIAALMLEFLEKNGI